MKARIKQSGQVVVLQEDKTIYCDGHNIYNAEDIEILPDTPATNEIDWEQRRWDLVKAATQGLCSNSEFERDYERFKSKLSWTEYYAENAIIIANAVLKEYRKSNKDKQ